MKITLMTLRMNWEFNERKLLQKAKKKTMQLLYAQ